MILTVRWAFKGVVCVAEGGGGGLLWDLALNMWDLTLSFSR